MKLKIIAIVVLAMIAAAGLGVYSSQKKTVAAPAKQTTVTTTTAPAKTPTTATNYCAGNSGQNIIVSISKQHLWACDGASTKYDSAVITGMEQYPADLTPTGTYHIYSKLTDQTLAGSDSTGSWSDFVNYWLPFLSNKYGVYGFHDLTTAANGANGRADSDFGNVDINAPYTAAKHASHGCVELPLATAKWLYNWSSVGTTVIINT